jgi:chromosome segregation ATPase
MLMAMDGERTLEDLNRQLAKILDRLLELAPDDFAEKHRLKTDQDRLRKLTRQYAQDRDAIRSSEDMLAELKARKSALEAFGKQMMGSAKMASAGLDAGSGGPGDASSINATMKSAHNINE